MNVSSLLDDPRTIKSVHFNDEYGSQYEVGQQGCTKIEIYGEPGQPHCLVPWLAVYVSDEVLTRIPATMVQVVYETDVDANAAGGAA